MLTVNCAVPITPENSAEIVVVPDWMPVATPPVLTELLMVAMDGRDDVQFTKLVRFCVSPLENVPFAPKATAKPAGTVRVGGFT